MVSQLRGRTTPRSACGVVGFIPLCWAELVLNHGLLDQTGAQKDVMEEVAVGSIEQQSARTAGQEK